MKNLEGSEEKAANFCDEKKVQLLFFFLECFRPFMERIACLIHCNMNTRGEKSDE